MDNDVLDLLFEKWTVLESWDTLLLAYKEMGFTDQINDSERIAEFVKIVEIMNSWIKKAEDKLRPFWPYNKDDGIEAVSTLRDRTKLDCRVNVVSARLKENWTEVLINKLNGILINEAQQWANEEEEDDEDGRGYYEF